MNIVSCAHFHKFLASLKKIATSSGGNEGCINACYGRCKRPKCMIYLSLDLSISTADLFVARQHIN